MDLDNLPQEWAWVKPYVEFNYTLRSLLDLWDGSINSPESTSWFDAIRITVNFAIRKYTEYYTLREDTSLAPEVRIRSDLADAVFSLYRLVNLIHTNSNGHNIDDEDYQDIDNAIDNIVNCVNFIYE